MYVLGTEKQLWSENRINVVIKMINAGKASMDSGLPLTSQETFWMTKFDVVKNDTGEILIFKKGSTKTKPIRIVPKEIFFDVLTEAHTKNNHGGRHRVAIEIKNKYFIPKNVIRLYVLMCPGCRTKRLVPKEPAPLRPRQSTRFNEKGTVNLINFKYYPDGEYKWLMYYQDIATKFINLRPLKTITPTEVTSELMKIFLTFGAPNILQMDMESCFMLQVKQEIVGMWPNCKVVPKTNSKTNECDRQELEYVMQTWMSRNETSKWSIGCYFVQHNKNNSIIRALATSPYNMIFGWQARADLCVSSIPLHIFKDTSANLNEAIKQEIKDNSGQDAN